jgi:hypothetical protein
MKNASLNIVTYKETFKGKYFYADMKFCLLCWGLKLDATPRQWWTNDLSSLKSSSVKYIVISQAKLNMNEHFVNIQLTAKSEIVFL